MKINFSVVYNYINREFLVKVKRLIIFLVIYTVVFFSIYKVFKYVIPFIVALIIALAMKPIKEKILYMTSKNRYIKVSNGCISFIMTLIIIGGVGGIIFTVIYKISDEMKNFIYYISNENTIDKLIYNMDKNLNIIKKLVEDISPEMLTKLNEIISDIAKVLSSLMTVFLQGMLSLLKAIPTTVIGIFIIIIITFFFIKDIEKIQMKLKKIFAPKGLLIIRKVKNGTGKVIGGYVKAYMIIMSVVSVITLFVFKLVEVDYALTLSIITGLVDVLPALGAGLMYGGVAIYMLISGDKIAAIIVLVGYGLVVIIRQLLEQKLVSSFLGVHPLVILLGLFLALTPLGIKGMIYFLGAVILFKIINQPIEKIKNN